jgi:hypothetical protein
VNFCRHATAQDCGSDDGGDESVDEHVATLLVKTRPSRMRPVWDAFTRTSLVDVADG